MLMTKHLPLPQRYAGGYLYSDRIDGVLHTPDGREIPLPMEVITSKGRPDYETQKRGRIALASAPEGSIYEVVRECRPEEDIEREVSTYRKVSANEWVLLDC
jgi:hypothetical protein